MESLITVAVLVVAFLIVLLLRRKNAVSPESPIKAVRAGGKTWTPYSGCLRDAQTEGWKWAALRDGRIIDVARMKDTARRLGETNKR